MKKNGLAYIRELSLIHSRESSLYPSHPLKKNTSSLEENTISLEENTSSFEENTSSFEENTSRITQVDYAEENTLLSLTFHSK